jgi:hypothetical protein
VEGEGRGVEERGGKGRRRGGDIRREREKPTRIRIRFNDPNIIQSGRPLRDQKRVGHAKSNF